MPAIFVLIYGMKKEIESFVLALISTAVNKLTSESQSH